MGNMDIIYVRPSKSFCSCNCCYARNYDSSYANFGERVDMIYEVQIGGMVPMLCRRCLKKLYEAVGDIINDSK